MENKGISFKEFSVTCYCAIIFMISEFAMILHALHTCILTMPIVRCTYIIGTLQEQCLSSLTANVIVPDPSPYFAAGEAPDTREKPI